MKEGTIPWAIAEVLRKSRQPLSVKEIYQAILEAHLYNFKADNPVHVVYGQVRRHCDGLDIPSAIDKPKYFAITTDGKYFLKQCAGEATDSAVKNPAVEEEKSDLSKSLRNLHQQYTGEFREKVLNQIKKLPPDVFEIFSRNLLKAYGFEEVSVTNKGADGGIDGVGQLKVGLAYMKVAFQCKRWKRKKIGRPEVDKFRGAIQGKCEQGIFFTTSSFTKDAEEASIQRGAVPVVLIDGRLILDLMIEKKFGVEVESMPVYSNVLDLVITETDD